VVWQGRCRGGETRQAEKPDAGDFFRPKEAARVRWTMPVPIYRDCRALLRRSDTGCVFVPVRGMQFQAVVDDEEIIFVDSQSYEVRNGVGGRVITLAWRPLATAALESVADPVPCKILYYLPGLEDTQRRLVGEFGKALRQQAEKTGASVPACGARVLDFKRSTT
jgi:hypothetical protein